MLTQEPASTPEPRRDRAGAFVTPDYKLAFAVVTALFFFWAIANNFNDILIKQFQKALTLTRMRSGLVQTAFYFGYFTIALPAGWVTSRAGYKTGILVGLCLYGAGALLFYPAAESRTFYVFLFALYVIAAGLAFLETSANPLIAGMGSADRAAQRLNFAQSFNGFGAFVAPFIGGAVIFSGIERTPHQISTMSPAALNAWRLSEARSVELPYLILAGLVFGLALLVWRVRFPEPAGAAAPAAATPGTATLRRHPLLKFAVVTQFFYVGAQVAIWSYFINFAQDVVHVGEKQAAQYLGFSLMTFMVGRFLGTALMRLVRPPVLLALYGAAAATLCAAALAAPGWAALIALGLTSFFMSIMFPTIFALGVEGLGTKTKLGASLLIMAIIGGAVFPPLLGAVADRAGSIQIAMGVPLISFLVVAVFGAFAAARSPARFDNPGAPSRLTGLR